MKEKGYVKDNIDRMREEFFERQQEFESKKMRDDEARHSRNMAHNLVPYLMRTNRITEEDYAKWALDKTGMFIPKIKTNE